MLEIRVEDRDAVSILHIKGEFYMESIDKVEEIWGDIITKSVDYVAINCSKIEYVDSSAIGILVKFHNLSKSEGKSLIFYDLNDIVMSIFHTAHLDSFFSIFSLEDFDLKFPQ